MPRIALAALVLVVVALVACEGTPEPPPPAQLLDDVRDAMRTAPSFRFEATWVTTAPGQGTSEVRIGGGFSGENAYLTSESIDQENSFFSETLLVDGNFYTRSPQTEEFRGSDEWQHSSWRQRIMGGREQREIFLPPESVDKLQLEQSQVDSSDVWTLSGENIATIHDNDFVEYSITPFTTYEWSIDPKTSRLLALEATTDYGIGTFSSDVVIEAGPQIFRQTYRFFDYDADITITVPPNVTPPAPTPTPRPGGEDADYTLLLETTDVVSPDEWDDIIRIVQQRLRSIPGAPGVSARMIKIGELELRLPAHTLTVEQATAIATPRGVFRIAERHCNRNHPCDAIDTPTRIDNAGIESASASSDSVTGEIVVLFEVTHREAVHLGTVTTRLYETNTLRGAPDQMAFVLDGETLVSAVVSSPILAGAGQISGALTKDEAELIAALISNDALPVPLRLVTAEAR